MINIEGIQSNVYGSGKTLQEVIPGGEHYAICNNCGLLHFKAIEITQDENTISEEAPLCNTCTGLNVTISKVAQHH